VSRRKPILAVKARGAAVVPREPGSHTAAAMRDDAVVDALLRQAGVLRFHSGEELFGAAEFFEGQPLPGGRRVAIVSNSTGMATLAADAASARGLVVGEVEDGRRNPLVLGIHATAGDYAAGAASLLADTAVDALMAFYVDLSGGDPVAVLAAVSGAAQAQDKPVVASVVGADGRLPPAELGGVPNFLFPDACAGVLRRAVQRREWLSRPVGQRPRYADVDPDAARAVVAARLASEAGEGWLTPDEGDALLAAYGVARVETHVCADAETACAVAETIDGPIALKASFPPPAHAGDVDAVLLGLQGRDAVRSAWNELERRVRAAGRPWTGAVVQPLVSAGADVIVGAVSDPALGTVMGIGLGGRQAGLARTMAFSLPPTTDVEADELIDASDAVATQLAGFRGSPVLDRVALRELILRVALLLEAAPEIVEADFNPIRCTPVACVTLDLRLRVERRRPVERVKTW
jgi:acyl-CoA synthetase (NDP forming)